MADLLRALAEFVQTLLRHPLLFAEIALVGSVLFGGGRKMGLPLLFWHERLGIQFLAGMAAVLLVGEVLFVTYLMEYPESPNPKLSMQQFLVFGAIAWGAVVLAALGYRLISRTQRGAERPTVVTPRFRRVENDQLSELTAADPPAWPFVVGFASGTVAVYGMGRLVEALFGSSYHAAATTLFALMLVGFFASPVSTPAIVMCLLLGMCAAAYGFLGYVLDSAGLAIIVAAGLLAVGGVRQRRLRIAALHDWYAEPNLRSYPPAAPAAGAAAGSRRLRFNDGVRGGGPHPLILICASGGGIRAATWTAAILEQLDTHRKFRNSVRVITGASGGMVGATAWVACLHARHTPAHLIDAVARDSLSPLAHRLVFHDIPFAFLPLLNANNRGQVLEDAWNAHTGDALRVSLGDLRAGEADGTLPSLVFTPMILEDGRRLIISNLDLSPITGNEVRWLGDPADGNEAPSRHGSDPATASLSAFHLEDIFPGALDRIPLSTAARLAASYPYVTPASVLPTIPSRRVGDAGYYDNYGLALACEWLRECVTTQRPWLVQNVSRVLLMQIRDNVSELSVAYDRPDHHDLQDENRFGPVSAAVARGFEWLTGPIGGLLAARESVMLFRNDAALEAATQLCDSELGKGFLTTTIFEFKGEASLSWYLTRTEFDGICGQARSRGIAGKTANVFQWLDL